MASSRRDKREPFETEVVTLHEDGYGLAADNKTGITGALPGETVVARPFTRRRRRLYARTEAIKSRPHPDRVTPICAAAAYCGGCSLQHLNPEAQLAWKERGLKQALKPVQPDIWLSPLEGPVRHYRYKARLGVKFVAKKGRVLVGFREEFAPFVAEMNRCETLAVPFDGMVASLQALISGLSVRQALPQIEVAIGDERGALVFRHLEPLTEADLDQFRAFSASNDIDVYLQPGGPDSVHKLAPGGEERLRYALPAHEIEMRFHPMDFTQVNPAINRRLVDQAMALLELSPHHQVWDLFCGIGNFTLPIARKVRFVTGIELAPGSIDRARENAGYNGVNNVEFRLDDLFADDLPASLFGAQVPDRVLLDPPRSGAEAVCKVLAVQKVERVVYVSCNPTTLARDVRFLTDHGYRLTHAGVIDMFPHTAHVESIACLQAI